MRQLDSTYKKSSHKSKTKTLIAICLPKSLIRSVLWRELNSLKVFFIVIRSDIIFFQRRIFELSSSELNSYYFTEMVAEFPLLEGRLTLSQSVPPAPVFLTFCFSKAIAPTLNTTSRLVQPSVNFINILRAAFRSVDPQSVRTQSS